MSVINDLINIESDSLDFGNYELATKTKKDGIEYKGDIYKIKTLRSAVCGCHLDRRNISVVLSDQRFCTESYITYRWTSGACGTFIYLAGHSMDPNGYRDL